MAETQRDRVSALAPTLLAETSSGPEPAAETVVGLALYAGGGAALRRLPPITTAHTPSAYAQVAPSSPSTRWSTNYRPDIDGLRALAVMLVLVGHVGLGLSGGFIGVDVFFVISGFLITRLLLSSYEAGIPLKDFWIRRIRRIVPAASVAVAATLIIGTCILPRRDLTLLGQSAIAPQLGYSNFYFWSHGGYFDLPSERQPLLHTWSLAVEEQFYLIWPLILLLAWKKRAVAATIGGLGLISLAASELIVQSNPATAFYFMPTRMWELLLGAGALFLPQLHRILGPVGMILILVPAASYTASTPFPGLSAIAPCLGTALIILSRSWITRLLSLGPTVYIGKMSYSIYLWHWPIWVFTRNPSITLIASLLIGWLSYELVEKPIRCGTVLKNPRRLIWVCGCVEALICATGYSLYLCRDARYAEASVRQEPQNGPIENAPGCADCPTLGAPGPARFVVWGDSHAMKLAKVFDGIAKAKGISGQSFAVLDLPPLLETCNRRMLTFMYRVPLVRQRSWKEQVVEWIKDHDITDVFIVARWEVRVPPQELMCDADDRLLQDGLSTGFSAADSRRVFKDGLGRTLDALAGRHVYFMMQVPPLRKNGTPITRQAYDLQQREVMRVLTACPHSHLHIIGPGDWFSGGVGRTGDKEGSYYDDDDHVSLHGAKVLIAPVLEPVFKRIGDRSQSARKVGQGTTP